MPYKNKADKSAYAKRWRKANPEKWTEITMRWRKKHPELVRAAQKRTYQRRKQRKLTSESSS